MKLLLVIPISLIFINCADRIMPEKRVYFKDHEAGICYSANRLDGAASGIDTKSISYVPCTVAVLKLIKKYK